MAFVTFWDARDAIATLDEVIMFKGGRQLKITISIDKNTKRSTVSSYTRGKKPKKQFPKNYTNNRNEPRPKPSKV